MQTDHQLQMTVMEQLDCDASINCSHIGVAVRDGVVTLTGHVPSLGEKRAAARAAGLVSGVKAVIDQIGIELPGHCQTADEVIAERAHARLSTNRQVPLSRIRLTVAEGVVTLTGDVDWHYQIEAIENDLHGLDCIRELRNEISIRPPVKAGLVHDRIRDALARIAPLDAERIVVETNGSSVSLSGLVNSFHEKGLAESVARAIPGVTAVTNDIAIA